MDTIYLVGSIDHYIEDVLNGFATDDAGIRALVAQYRHEVYDDEPLIVVDRIVDRVIVTDDEGYQQMFYIHTLRRVQP